MILRFVHVDGPVTRAILFATGGLYSHVEAVMRAGTYLGAHTTGVEERPANYDANGFTRQRFLSLPGPAEMNDKFEHYLRAVLGEPYDYAAIAGFTFHIDRHQENHTICSALIALALRGCEFFRKPLPIAAHAISVRDLELGLCMRDDVAEVGIDDLRLHTGGL